MNYIRYHVHNITLAFVTIIPLFFLINILNKPINPSLLDRFILLVLLILPVYVVFLSGTIFSRFINAVLKNESSLPYDYFFMMIINILIILNFVRNIFAHRMFFSISSFLLAVIIFFHHIFFVFYCRATARHAKQKDFFNILLIPFIVLFYSISISFQIDKTDYEANISERYISRDKLVIFCIDGLSQNILDPYIEENSQGLFATIAEDGIYASIETIYPTHSPIIWTTVASGETPMKHGILGFGKYRFSSDFSKGFAIFPKNFGLLKYFNFLSKLKITSFHPNLSTDIRVPMIWDILFKAGYNIKVLNYPVSLPPSKISPLFISETEFLMHFGEIFYERVYPSAFKDKIDLLYDEYANKAQERFDGLFLSYLRNRDEYSINLARTFFTNDFIVLNTALELNKLPDKMSSDLDIIYFHGLDGCSHLFFNDFFDDIQSGKTPMQTYLGKYLNFIENKIEQYIMDLNASFNILIISDHGFHAKGIPGTIADPFSPHLQGLHENAPEGVFMAMGSNVKTNYNMQMTVYDITPTVLGYFNIPSSVDFPGNYIDIFSEHQKLEDIMSYRAIKRIFHITEIEVNGIKHQSGESILRSLGYIN